MDTLKFTHDENKTTYEIWFLSKSDSKGWAPREDGSFRYMSVGLGTVVIENSNHGWYWNEYDANDSRVTGCLQELIDKNWKMETMEVSG